jgi:hypothetical protein
VTLGDLGRAQVAAGDAVLARLYEQVSSYVAETKKT